MFFFKQKTTCEMRISVWSSDVCSSDLGVLLSDDISMDALKCSLGERAGAALAAGCDVALHCNCKPEEMEHVAAAVGALSPEAQRRIAAEIGRASCRERVCQYV